jgi:hypothetical protein
VWNLRDEPWLAATLLLLVGSGLAVCSDRHRSAPTPAAEPCSLRTTWLAEQPYHDYFEFITFDDEQHGALVLIDNQASFSIDFRYRMPSTDRLELEYLAEWVDERQRSLRYRVDAGAFTIIAPPSHTDPNPREVRCRCRLRFDEDPFPEGVQSRGALDYYAGCPGR